MSFFIKTEESKYMSWSNFLLLESFRPKEISFGTNENTNNKKFLNQDNFILTFFKAFEYYFVVIFDKVEFELGFGISEEFSSVTSDYTHKRLTKLDSIQTPKLFSYVLYISLEILRKIHPEKIKFRATETTFNLYELLVKNKTFLNILEQEGYFYKGQFDNYYWFDFIDDKSIDNH